jgi:hypothetical protein
MVFENGKTQEIDRGQPEHNFATQQRRMELVQDSSRPDGIDPHGNNSAGSSRQTSSGTTINERETPPGKILERLDFIENAYLSYVDGHQRDLEARLVESKQQKEAFKSTVQELKKEIYDLVAEKEQSEQNE